MKILVSLLFLFLLPFISTAQSQDWKQIESPFSTAIKVMHQSSHGFLFGQMNITRKNYFSKDKGTSWSLLPDDFSFTIREDLEGTIYYASNSGIYKFDPISLQSQLYLPIHYAEDLAFLRNGNVVVAASREFYLFSDQGQKIFEHTWFTHSAKILLDSTGQKHFVTNSLGASMGIIEFNDDLSYISHKRPIQHQEYYRRGGRIFGRLAYSDDAINWTNLNFPPNVYATAYNVSQDGTLLYVQGPELYISNDNGVSFTVKTLPGIGYNYVSSDDDGTIVISHSQSDPVLYISEDSGQSWNLIQSFPSQPYIQEFAPGIDENLYTASRYYYSYHKENEWSDWQADTLDLFGVNALARPYNLSNGANLALSNDYRLLETPDKGKTWEPYSDQYLYFLNPEIFVEKSDALYSRYQERLNFSLDFGRTWELYESADQDIMFGLREQYVQSTDYSIYLYGDFVSGSNKLIYYNFKTGEKQVNPALANGYAYTCSFYDQTLYAIKYVQQEYFLCISTDRGATFTDRPITSIIGQHSLRMHIDHLNNIYIYTDKKIWYSYNQGDTWEDISPDFPELLKINNLIISFDNYIYLATVGMGILKYNPQLRQPKKLTVKVLDDQNKNCAVDSAEPTLKSLNVLVNDSYLRPVNEMGEATFLLNTALNEIKVVYNPELYQECESSFTVEFEDNDTELHLDIPLKVLKYCADPVVGLSVPFLRRCFDNTYSGSVCNEGNIESINTEIEITLDPFFDFISASLPIKSINGQILILDAGHIQPGDCQSFHFVVNVNCDSELGQEHCISAYTSTGSTDCGDATARDAYVDCQENIGAYDPNDKNIFVNGNRNQTYIEPGDKIEYLIRFQNTGTDTAFTVRIEDPITKKFNVSSLKPVAASHEYTWSVNNGMLVVLFEDIQLVDSFKNEPASHGFIKFEIQLDSLTLRGDDVKNLAGIFFDFNEAIITEEVVTVIGQPLNTKEHFFESITAFPNPANGLVYISGEAMSDKLQNLMIYDIHGKLILSQKINQHDNRIDISKCAPGTYLLMMKSGERVYRGKMVKL